MRRPVAILALALPTLLAGCDLLGIETASALAARREAEGKAIGAGCRHSARSVEQCYEMNKRADKAAVFAGWKEMNDYMRENKIEASPPPAVEPAAEDVKPDAKADAKSDAKPDAKADPKAAKPAAAKPAEAKKS